MTARGVVRTTRERTSVCYEIDHAGRVLVVRMYPTDDGHGEATWRIEATVAQGAQGASSGAPIAAAAATRAAALDGVARAWLDARRTQQLPHIDWTVIASLLRASHAL